MLNLGMRYLWAILVPLSELGYSGYADCTASGLLMIEATLQLTLSISNATHIPYTQLTNVAEDPHYFGGAGALTMQLQWPRVPLRFNAHLQHLKEHTDLEEKI
jgi:hypothetical protein